MPKERKYRYYVEHHDDYTNEVLARQLSPQFDCEPRTFWTGRVAPAWEVPSRRFVNFLKKSKKSLGIEFDAFIQEDNHPLRPFPWPIPKRPMPKKKVA